MWILRKTVLISILFAFIFAGCSVGTNNLEKEPERKLVREEITDQLITEIYEIVFALQNKDLEQLKRYIHPTFGYYDVFKIDGIKAIVHKKNINNFAYEGLEELNQVLLEREEDINSRAFKIATPSFDCSFENDKNYGWSESGLFINADVKEYLSNYMLQFNKLNKDFYKKEDLYKAKIIEKTGYQVVLTPYIIFYVTKLDDKFYITLFDRALTDCSK